MSGINTWLKKISLFRRKTSVDEVMHLAKDQQDQIEELKKMEVYRREFLGNVSHELKTPLFNIQGYILTLLEGGMEDPSILKEYLKRSEKNIDRMIAVIQDLEAISQFESGEMKLSLTRIDISALTQEVIDLLEIKARYKNIRLICEADPNRPFLVVADKERIRQVLINLIDNSIKYSNEGGQTRVSFKDLPEGILTEITDNGIGIATKDIPRLSERFFRVDKSRSREQGGSGLGLAIVKHFLEAHGSGINVRSELGKGSTFSFILKKP
ncbi:MAG: ATP-binding protein [Bacteroidota bacterium]|nr:ATP-binding protein [Bacteroidota bacterium]